MRPHFLPAVAIAVAALGLSLSGCGPAPLDYSGPVAGWPDYGGTKGGLRYSPLTQITSENVRDLELAWVHHNGDVSDGSDGATRTSFNATPILADDTLYFCTGFNRVIAAGGHGWSEPGDALMAFALPTD